MRRISFLLILSFLIFFACGKKEKKETVLDKSSTEITHKELAEKNIEEIPKETDKVEEEKNTKEETIKEIVKETIDKGQGNLAILIDDAGASLELAKDFGELNMNISFAVLPYLAKSKEVNEYLSSRGYTVILHLPMEGSDTAVNDRTEGLLKSNLPQEEMKYIFDKALENVGAVRGFNNHMGSVFTSSKESMEVVLSHAKDRRLFYIDSKTIASSKGYKTAREFGIPTAQSVHFLDNSKNVEDIEKELIRAAKISQNKGKALVIGHFHKNMLEALKNKKETLIDSGINLIFVDEILE